MKKCKRCNKDKDFNSFCKTSKNKDGYNNRCRECIKELGKDYYKNNKEIMNLKAKKWYGENKEKHIKHTMNYQSNNPEKKKKYTKKWNKNNRDYFKKWRKNKYDNDPNFKLRITLSVRLSGILRNEKTYKTSSIIKLIGCTLDELKLYIEKQFILGMDWNNWGEIWEVDHIKACAKFDLTNMEHQKQCFHYTNLMPRFKTTIIAEEHGSDQIGNRNKSDK